MLIEALIITSCLSYNVCHQPITAYYESRPTLQNFVNANKDKADRYLAKNLLIRDGLVIISPLFALGLGRTADIPIYHNLFLSVNGDKTLLKFTTGF